MYYIVLLITLKKVICYQSYLVPVESNVLHGSSMMNMA